jgi:hypothetical protein
MGQPAGLPTQDTVGIRQWIVSPALRRALVVPGIGHLVWCIGSLQKAFAGTISPVLWSTVPPRSKCPIHAHAPTLSAGSYCWRVRASNSCGNGSWSDVWHLEIFASATAPPVLVAPASGSFTGDRTPTFAWSPVTVAASYDVQVDDDAGFGSPEIDIKTASTEYTPTSPLATGSWHWRVRACNVCGESGWSSEWTLTIADRKATLPLCLRRYAS